MGMSDSSNEDVDGVGEEKKSISGGAEDIGSCSSA
jgi:hypothetical protein